MTQAVQDPSDLHQYLFLLGVDEEVISMTALGFLPSSQVK